MSTSVVTQKRLHFESDGYVMTLGQRVTRSEPSRGCVSPWECLRRQVKIEVLPLLHKHLHFSETRSCTFNPKVAFLWYFFRLGLKVSGNALRLSLQAPEVHFSILKSLYGRRTAAGVKPAARRLQTWRCGCISAKKKPRWQPTLCREARHNENTKWVLFKFCCVTETCASKDDCDTH